MLTKTPTYAPALTSGDSPASFEYTKEQWAEIRAAIQPVWEGPLPRDVREELIRAARWYLTELLDIFPKARQEAQAWQKIADLVEASRHIAAGLAEQHLKFLKNAGAKRCDQLDTRRWYAENFIDPLCAVRNNAKKSVESCKERLRNNNARLEYLSEVLSVWTMLGGELGVSRHPKTGKIQGPLARFFRAVTVPVMEASAPSLETLPNIVRRQKKFGAL